MAAGEQVSVRRFRQRQQVLVAMLHAGQCPKCASWVEELLRTGADLGSARIACILVRPEPVSNATASESALFEVVDSTGDIRARWLPDSVTGAGLVLVDRYGRVLRVWREPDADMFPTMAVVLADFAFADQEDCACGLPAWPEEIP